MAGKKKKSMASNTIGMTNQEHAFSDMEKGNPVVGMITGEMRVSWYVWSCI